MTVMSPEILEFLRREHRAFLFCRDRSGRPIGYPMRTMAFANGTLIFATYTKSAKVANVRANPNVACVVTSGQEADASWVSVRGIASIDHPPPEEIDAMVGGSSHDSRPRHGGSQSPRSITERQTMPHSCRRR